MAAPVIHVPPQNIEAEESVLGAVLVSEPALATVIGEVELRASDFYFDRNAILYSAVRDLYESGQPTDELAVADVLNQRGQIDSVGGRHYVSEVAAKVPAAGNAKHYAEIVQRDARERDKIEIGRKLSNGLGPAEAIEHLGKLVAPSSNRGGGLSTMRASEIRLRRPQALDGMGMIFKRSMTVAFGTAGLGKTLWSIHTAAATTRGTMHGLEGPAPVLISSQEDDAEAVIGPRLVAAGADRDLVHIVTGLFLPSQVPALEAEAKAVKAALVIIDPIAAHFDASIDSHKDASTRAALAPLAEMASNLDLALLVVAHPNKSAGMTTLSRLSGSGAFGNAPRSVIVFGADPTDPDGPMGSQRIVAHAKCNVAPLGRSHTVKITTTKVETEDGPADVPKLEIVGLSDHTADDVLTNLSGEELADRDQAQVFLLKLLADTAVRTKEIEAAAKAEALSWRTVERAKKSLGIVAKQGPDGWYWLPQGETEL